MKKTLSKVLTGLLIATLFLLTGCDEKTSVKTVKETTPTQTTVNKTAKKSEEKKEAITKVTATKKNTIPKVDLSDVFKDAAMIKPDGKYMILIFEAETCPYCRKLELDIHNNKKLYDELKNDFTTYSLNASKNRLHKLMHEGKPMDVDTRTLIDIYNVTSTPTLIFADKKGKSIFIVPGYMPTKQFLATLEFVKSGLWLGKDRKNGEIYKTLKEFYIKKGIIKEKK